MPSYPPAMNRSELEAWVDSVEWRFAKTMPWLPHWYNRLAWLKPEQQPAFRELARLIFEEGYEQVWGKKGQKSRYYDIGEFQYWSCDPTIESTDLINRAIRKK
jgi:hypothetical protein